MTLPLTYGQQLARAAMDWIEANPEHWDQSDWHCGTTHCFAGVVQMLHGKLDPREEFDGDDPRTCTVAAQALGIPRIRALTWFDGDNTLDHLRDFVRGFSGKISGNISDEPVLAREAACHRPDLSVDQVESLAKDRDRYVRESLVYRLDLSDKAIDILSRDVDLSDSAREVIERRRVIRAEADRCRSCP